VRSPFHCRFACQVRSLSKTLFLAVRRRSSDQGWGSNDVVSHCRILAEELTGHGLSIVGLSNFASGNDSRGGLAGCSFCPQAPQSLAFGDRSVCR
jgi:hypothetical protein